MGGQAYTAMKVGDPCWVVVDSANTPTGRFKAVVEAVERHARPMGDCERVWFSVTARIKDTRAEDRDGGTPTTNYAVYPATSDFTNLLDRIDDLERAKKRIEDESRIQIDTLTDALVALKRAG